MKDSFARNEAPFVPHLLYTQVGVLDDTVPSERQKGLDAGKDYLRCINALAVYEDFGHSAGMQGEMEYARRLGIPILFRTILPEAMAGLRCTP